VAAGGFQWKSLDDPVLAPGGYVTELVANEVSAAALFEP
jgi:hypothetical protein